MPELPEVETIARGLDKKIRGNRILRFDILDNKLASAPVPLTGATIDKVYRLGKQIVFVLKLDSDVLYLVIHLRMSGRLLLQEKNESNSLSENFANLDEILKESEIYLTNKISLKTSTRKLNCFIRAIIKADHHIIYFFDIRRFGTFKWEKNKPSLPAGSLDPLDRNFTVQKLKMFLDKSVNQEIKNFLLRQDRITGIGNIYASEILFRTGTSPFEKCGNISDNKIILLYEQIRAVLIEAISNSGTTLSDYQTEEGKSGEYQNQLKVYGRENLSCYCCGSKVIRVTQQQRSTFYCPKCQKKTRK
ncbi:MAG TPA: bifunctional DNA-formamidopyrimidine glycosylase/DNA-(apurinic or apyrimidinic site) lyase [Oligoflexia bacterium]|nr:bifunctional DNA-formamidopyrimidine glycosylase/DNA-(apurinic or apyrimidinic site) lyase [Oligoflexia bacterium]HMP47826.1 bifunctional DNA-formamidopyrimidine glycosylase/DNA-(apurinic or apyrimidinic site) lyase [Oligoflexia bacterium]